MRSNKIFQSLGQESISRNINKAQKLLRERGAGVVLIKLGQLTAKRLTQSAAKRTILKRNSIFKNLDKQALKQDIERYFSAGLFRALDEIRSDIRAIPTAVSDEIIEETKTLLDNKFTIYGHLKLNFDSDQFSWWRDPLTGFEWPQILTRAQLKTQKPYGTDIKTIWEIARFQFLSPVAQAYILTGEEQYVRFAINKVNSWIEENHFCYGPNWTVAMESTIRLINWCVNLPLLDVLKYTDQSFKDNLTKSILEHLVYIHENLESSPSSAGNHYFADLVGLLLARLLFPSIPWAIATSEFAEREFEREVRQQFMTSGINFEGSLPYHRLGSEMLLIGVALIKKSGRELSSAVVERLNEVADFTKYYTDTCENCPIIGDNDSGIFVKFFIGQELNQYRYLMCLFDCILGNKVAPNSWEEYLCSIHFTSSDPSYIYGTNKLNEDNDKELQVKDFNGLVIAKHKSEAIFFNALHSTEGHTHNDKLSIFPIIGKKPLFIDHGSFSYSGFTDKRHKDRMTPSHNGPVINGWEQSRIWENDLFYINGEAKCSTFIESSDNILSITACHHGYRRYSPGMKMFRKVVWKAEERIMMITDWVESNKPNKNLLFTWNFLLNPDWTVILENNTLKLTYKALKVYFVDINGIGFTLTQDYYCPNYQKESSCQALKASWEARHGEKIQFLLEY